jgi:hypothetical protein
MWELPGWMEDGHREQPGKKTLEKFCRSTLGPGWRAGGEIIRVGRTLTHRKILFVVLAAIAPKAAILKKSRGRARYNGDAIWAKKADLAALPIATAQRAAIKAANSALEDGQGKLFGDSAEFEGQEPTAPRRS